MRAEKLPLALDRRTLALGLVAVTAAACAKSGGAAAGGPVGDDMSLGNPNAPVKMVEYASVACPVCGRWYREVWASFKAKYVDTGKVYYTFREMLVGDATEQSIAAAGFLLARCAGRDKYFSVVDAVFQDQADIYNDPRGGLLKIAKSIGVDEKTFDACTTDSAQLQALNNRVQGFAQNNNVNSTPTFVINGTALEAGYHTLAELDAAIAGAQSGAKS
jgi:protein-disulfide isomerase